jgi:short-subunit dehydrogenase
MLLEHKSAVIYGAGGAIGGAVARAFAREGARLFLPGRTLAKLDAVARAISAADVGNVAVLMASDYAGSMTGTVANMSCSQIID